MTALLSASLIVTVIASQKLALESMSSDFFASFLSYLFTYYHYCICCLWVLRSAFSELCHVCSTLQRKPL